MARNTLPAPLLDAQAGVGLVYDARVVQGKCRHYDFTALANRGAMAREL